MTTRKTRLLSLLGASILATALMPVMPAFAAPGCTVDAVNATMNVTASEATRIIRGGANTEDIQVVPAAGGSDVCPATAGNEHTVFDIDTVVVTGSGPLTIDMSGGQFAPGFNTESGTDEIEFFVSGTMPVTIQGGASADNWTFTKRGVGLNPDTDADVVGGTLQTPADLAASTLTANGGDGGDTFVQAEARAETLIGGAGTDSVEYNTHTTTVTVTLNDLPGDGVATENDNVQKTVERVVGGSGDDSLDATGADLAANFLYGELGVDTLMGGAGTDVLFGGAGADILNGGTGRDTLNGGADNDSETGGEGKDTFNQEAAANGSDTLNGDAGKDTVKYNLRTAGVSIAPAAGGDGATGENDTVNSDIEVLVGGKANDTLTAPNGANYTLSGGAGVDTLTGGDPVNDVGGNDTLIGGDGNDAQMRGGAGNDSLNGGDGDEVITGGAGKDSLNGGDGVDQMNGEAGSDRLSGGSGSDKLWGDGTNPKVRDTLIGGSPTTGPNGDTCERDTKDVRSGCEGRETGAAPTS